MSLLPGRSRWDRKVQEELLNTASSRPIDLYFWQGERQRERQKPRLAQWPVQSQTQGSISPLRNQDLSRKQESDTFYLMDRCTQVPCRFMYLNIKVTICRIKSRKYTFQSITIGKKKIIPIKKGNNKKAEFKCNKGKTKQCQ